MSANDETKAGTDHAVVPMNWWDVLRLANPVKATRVASGALVAVAQKAASSYSTVADLRFRSATIGSLLDRSV